MRTKKVTVTFERDNPIINGKRTTPHSDGNNGRSVYISDGYVLKVNDRGYTHSDMDVWKSIGRGDRKYFVPCLAEGSDQHGNGWSLQPYVELDWDVSDEAREIVYDLVDKYGLSDIDTFETSPRNWAINAKTGEPIIFDYGL